MSEYTKLRVRADHDHTSFTVEVKGWFGWQPGSIYTSYFNIAYSTKEDAINAIKGYKDRFSEVD